MRWFWQRWKEERERQEFAESERGKFMIAQEQAAIEGREIAPPWICWPERQPWEFNQSYPEWWMLCIYLPFWKRMSKEERIAYVEKWNAPQFWRETMLGPNWLNIGLEEDAE